jgi:hypothetical protein
MLCAFLCLLCFFSIVLNERKEKKMKKKKKKKKKKAKTKQKNEKRPDTAFFCFWNLFGFSRIPGIQATLSRFEHSSVF